MSNPFDALNISDDEDDQFVQTATDKVRKSIPSFYNSPQIKKRA